MAKKKGLGRDVNKSLEIIDELKVSLDKFRGSHLKKGLSANHVDDANILKMVDKVAVDAVALLAALENLSDKVNAIKVNRSSRFSERAASSVVARFLSDQS